MLLTTAPLIQRSCAGRLVLWRSIAAAKDVAARASRLNRKADRDLKFDALNARVINAAFELRAAEIETDHLQLRLRFSTAFDARCHGD